MDIIQCIWGQWRGHVTDMPGFARDTVLVFNPEESRWELPEYSTAWDMMEEDNV